MDRNIYANHQNFKEDLDLEQIQASFYDLFQRVLGKVLVLPS